MYSSTKKRLGTPRYSINTTSLPLICHTHTVHTSCTNPLRILIFPLATVANTIIHYMATPSRALIFFFLCMPAILAKANIPEVIYPNPCNCCKENETRLHMYLHQFPHLPGVPNRNEYTMVTSSEPIGFGTMIVHDWILTTGLSATENVVGRLQGFHLQAGQTTTSWYTAHTIVFREGR